MSGKIQFQLVGQLDGAFVHEHFEGRLVGTPLPGRDLIPQQLLLVTGATLANPDEAVGNRLRERLTQLVVGEERGRGQGSGQGGGGDGQHASRQRVLPPPLSHGSRCADRERR